MRIIFCICLFLLSACTTLTPSPAQNQPLAWKQRLTQLQRISQWTLQGTAGISTAENAWSASLLWQQTPKSYALHLLGPLGVNHIQLAGTTNQATLISPSQPAVIAKDPETLLQQELGWQIPVSHLQYWIRGIPAPGKPARYRWDNVHHLTQLNQDNWDITYLEYGNINGIDLPTKMTLRNATIRVRLVIRQWQL